MGTESAPGDENLVRRARRQVSADLGDAFRHGESPTRRAALTRLGVGGLLVTGSTSAVAAEAVQHSTHTLHVAGSVMSGVTSSPAGLGTLVAGGIAAYASAAGMIATAAISRRGDVARAAKESGEIATLSRGMGVVAGAAAVLTAGVTGGITLVIAAKHGVPVPSRDAFDAAEVCAGVAASMGVNSVVWKRRQTATQRRIAPVDLAD